MGSNEVKIGVIDSGIALHEDLDENTVGGRDFMEGNNASLTTDDIEGHGTHVSGIIGGIGNNEIGISGINWNISLVPLQVDNNIVDNAFDIQACIDAINYATASYETDNPIRIINLSLETDCVVASLCNLAREKGQNLIKGGLVEHNYETAVKIDTRVVAGDIISARGYGKFVIRDISQTTKKGRIRLLADKYI